MADFDFVTIDAPTIYNTVVGQLMEECKEPLYPGDERRIFAEGIVQVFLALYSQFNDNMKQRTLAGSRGVVTDAIGEMLGVTRAAPAAAYATFRFSASQAQSENIIISEGTRITPDGSVYFATDTNTVLQAGETYVDVRATCTEGGAQYNGYAVGTIATLVDLIPYIESAKNTTISTGGDDGEPYTDEGDERFKERIRLAPAMMTTAGPESSYRYFALSADPDIIDVAIDSPSANIINIYPLMRGGALPDEETLDKVEAACNADSVRPMTDNVTAKTPTTVNYSVNIKYYCTLENEADTIKAIEGEGGAIDLYNEWQQAALGRDINPDYLRKLILSPTGGLAGADRVTINSPSYTSVDKTEVAKLTGAVIVTHEVI